MTSMSPLSSDHAAGQAAERPVRKVVTDRSAGNLADHVGDDPGAVAANRARLAELIGLPASDVVYMEQIHSPNVTEVTPSCSRSSAEHRWR